MSDLRTRLIRLAHSRPDLRPHLLPLVRQAAGGYRPQVILYASSGGTDYETGWSTYYGTTVEVLRSGELRAKTTRTVQDISRHEKGRVDVIEDRPIGTISDPDWTFLKGGVRWSDGKKKIPLGSLPKYFREWARANRVGPSDEEAATDMLRSRLEEARAAYQRAVDEARADVARAYPAVPLPVSDV